METKMGTKMGTPVKPLAIPEAQFETLLGATRGGYLDLSWAVVDELGMPCPDNVLREGRFIVAENYYGYMVTLICKTEKGELFLVPCVRED